MTQKPLNTLDQYGYNFQLKVIASLLNHKSFLNNAYDMIDPEYFGSQSLEWVVSKILNYHKKYHNRISLENLKIEVKKVDNDVLKTSIISQLRQIYSQPEEDDKYIQEEFIEFCKNQIMRKALLESIDLMNEGEYDTIFSKMSKAIIAGQDKNIGTIVSKDVKNSVEIDDRNPIPTPWEEINVLCDGGLGKGDFGLIFGPPGSGKSWTLVDIGYHAAKLGYNVVYYSLELGERYIEKRFYARSSKIPVQNLVDNVATIEKYMNDIKGYIIVKEYPPKRVNLDTLKANIHKIKETLCTPDLILIDYADLMSVKSKKYSDPKDSIDDIYIGIKGLAKELQIPIWSASQINRAGLKDRIIESDKIAGSFDKIMITDLGISLSRTKEDKISNTGRFHLMKNRYGDDGITFDLEVNLNYGLECFNRQFY
jgi:replicative DNA helicase